MQILKQTGAKEDYKANCAWISVLKSDWTKRETRNVNTGRGFRQECCLSPTLFNIRSKYLTNEDLKGLETVKYAVDLVLLAK